MLREDQLSLETGRLNGQRILWEGAKENEQVRGCGFCRQRDEHRTAHQAPQPENPIACRTVRRNWAPKMKKKAMKLNELSDL